MREEKTHLIVHHNECHITKRINRYLGGIFWSVRKNVVFFCTNVSSSLKRFNWRSSIDINCVFSECLIFFLFLLENPFYGIVWHLMCINTETRQCNPNKSSLIWRLRSSHREKKSKAIYRCNQHRTIKKKIDGSRRRRKKCMQHFVTNKLIRQFKCKEICILLRVSH